MHKSNRFKTNVLSLFLVFALLFSSLTACGTQEPADTSSSVSSETDSKQESTSTGSTSSTTESESTSEPESEEQVESNSTSSEIEKESESQKEPESEKESESQKEPESEKASDSQKESESQKEPESEPATDEPSSSENNDSNDLNTPGLSLSDIPAFSGDYYIVLNDNVPHFSTKNLSSKSYEFYSELDSLGRCGVAHACLGKDLMPADDEKRGSISSIKPTGWIQANYSCIIGDGHLWDRSHLIAWSLANENANKKNLITGTQHMNQREMTKFEDMVRDYIKETGNHVMYRVTPYFDGQNLVATGVQMEAWSVEDGGEDICFNVFIYNVQDGVHIDYATGESYEINPPESETETESENESDTSSTDDALYMVNKSNGKIHKITCGSVSQTGENNRVFFSTWEEALAYSLDIKPGKEKIECGNCHAYSENEG